MLCRILMLLCVFWALLMATRLPVPRGLFRMVFGISRFSKVTGGALEPSLDEKLISSPTWLQLVQSLASIYKYRSPPAKYYHVYTWSARDTPRNSMMAPRSFGGLMKAPPELLNLLKSYKPLEPRDFKGSFKETYWVPNGLWGDVRQV